MTQVTAKQKSVLEQLKTNSHVYLPWSAERTVRALFAKGLVSYRSVHKVHGDVHTGWCVTAPRSIASKELEQV